MATIGRVDEARGARKSAVSAEILDRQPPQNLEAERGVLGSILLLPDVCDEVALVLRHAADFYDEANARIYSHMLALRDAGRRIDITLLMERLRTDGDLEFVGGAPYLAEVARSVPHAAHATHYAQIVRDKAVLRSLIHSSTDILRDVYDESYEARDMLRRAEEKIFSILDDQTSGQA